MSETVRVPYGDDAGETATLLLAAAEDKDLGPEVVRTDTSTTGHFVVPKEVADAAGVEVEKDDDEADEKPAKKTAAKKTAKSGK